MKALEDAITKHQDERARIDRMIEDLRQAVKLISGLVVAKALEDAIAQHENERAHIDRVIEDLTRALKLSSGFVVAR